MQDLMNLGLRSRRVLRRKIYASIAGVASTAQVTSTGSLSAPSRPLSDWVPCFSIPWAHRGLHGFWVRRNNCSIPESVGTLRFSLSVSGASASPLNPCLL